MRTNIKIFLVALMAMVGSNVWATNYNTWPAGTYYFGFSGFNETSDQKVFGAYLFGTSYDYQSYITLKDGAACNDNVTQNTYQEYQSSDGTYIEAIVIELTNPVSIGDDLVFVQLGIGANSGSKNWTTFGWKRPNELSINTTPSSFSKGVYYLKITRESASTYSAAWQTSGSLPACANAGHTVTFAANNGSLGSITTAKQGASGSATDIFSGSTLIEEETTVRLVASPTGTNVFIGWKNSSDEYVSYDADYSFPMPDENVSLTAVFEVKRQVDGCANCFTVE